MNGFECVLDVRASLGECPVWSVAQQVLWWVDINGRTLNRFDPATGRNTATAMPTEIGSFALRSRGGFVLALRDGIWLAGPDGVPAQKLVDAPYDPSHHRFNDGRCDAWGRFWVGTMNERRDAPSGALYRVDPDGSIRAMITGITISNGLGFAPRAATMYHADTPEQTVSAWRFDGPAGTLSARRTFIRWTGETERPDGAAVDSEGHYWVAFYRGGKVVRVAPDGHVVAEYPTPAMCPTMCAFGGPDLGTLYVTSARQQRPEDELVRYPRSGGLFAFRPGVTGMPEPAFAG